MTLFYRWRIMRPDGTSLVYGTGVGTLFSNETFDIARGDMMNKTLALARVAEESPIRGWNEISIEVGKNKFPPN